MTSATTMMTTTSLHPIPDMCVPQVERTSLTLRGMTDDEVADPSDHQLNLRDGAG